MSNGQVHVLNANPDCSVAPMCLNGSTGPFDVELGVTCAPGSIGILAVSPSTVLGRGIAGADGRFGMRVPNISVALPFAPGSLTFFAVCLDIPTLGLTFDPPCPARPTDPTHDLEVVGRGRGAGWVVPPERIGRSAAGRRLRLGDPDATVRATGTMTTPSWIVRRLHELDDRRIGELTELLIDCVEGGASVGFMLPLARDRATAFWRRVGKAVGANERALLVAEDALGVCGTVQLVLALPENQPHRADLAKMLVHRRVRRQGLGAALMRAAESMARECGRTLLVLDAVTGGDAARLYERLGWVRVGDVPGFALYPGGGYCSTTYFYRDLRR
jgi:GNAT superfamily N-acetyltransferase